MGRHPRPSPAAAHHGRPSLERRGRRRGTIRLAVVALCRAGPAGPAAPRLATVGPGPLGLCGIPLLHVVAPDAPARPVLAATPGTIGRPLGSRRRLGPSPRLVDPAR